MKSLGLLGFVAIGSVAFAAPAQAPRDPLAPVEGGRWKLHEIGTTVGDTSVCVADPKLLLQIRHGARSCSRTEIDRTDKRLGVRYSCSGAGYGQTTVTVETKELLRIQTQGIVGGAPFQHDYEARRVGACV